MVKVLFDKNAGKHERVGLGSKLHRDATINGQLKNNKINYIYFFYQQILKNLDAIPSANLNDCMKRLRKVANQPEQHFEADDTVMR